MSVKTSGLVGGERDSFENVLLCNALEGFSVEGEAEESAIKELADALESVLGVQVSYDHAGGRVSFSTEDGGLVVDVVCEGGFNGNEVKIYTNGLISNAPSLLGGASDSQGGWNEILAIVKKKVEEVTG